MKQLVVDRFNDLTDSRPPATPRLRPRGSDYSAWADRGPELHKSATTLVMVRPALKALIDDIRAQSRGPHTGHPRVGSAAQGKEGVR